MKTLIIIPAYNESDNIESLINDIKSFKYDYLIINDNSTDDTDKIAIKNNFNLLDLSVNIGLAGVTRTGFKYAKDNGYECVICVDGDGQHQPKYIHKLIKCIEDGNDYAIGSRFIDKQKSFSPRMIGSRILTLLIKAKTKRTVTDPTSGMRALGRNVIEEFANDMNFCAEPDTVCHLLRKGYKVKEVQVKMLERQGGVSYFANPIKSFKYMVCQIISIIFIQ